MDILQETISMNVSGRNTGKCIEINCQCCTFMGESRNDTKGRGGIFFESTTTGYNCFNCGFKFRQDNDKPLSKNAKIFLECIGVEHQEIQKIMFVFRKNAMDNPLADQLFDRKKKYEPVELNFKPTSPPKDAVFLVDILSQVDQDHPAFKAYAYAHDRGIEKNPYLMWSPSTQNNLNEYLIMPFVYNNNIVGYQARYFGSNEYIIKNKRFINHSPNNGYLYGIENVYDKEKKYLFINESLIDSYIYNGVGLMNHDINRNQINIINQFKGKKIIIPDFGSGSRRLIDIALENDWYVYFPFWDDGKDLGKATNAYGKIFLTHNIINTATNNKLTIEIKRKTLL